MKYILKNLLYFVLITIVAVYSSSCSLSDKSESISPSPAPSIGVSNNTAFSDIFSEFNELKNVSAGLLNSKTDLVWWQKFDSIYNNVNAVYEENNAINMSGKLGGMDKFLSQALVSVSSSYKDAFDIMNAAKDNDDSEIQQYAYNDFSNKISSANNQWEHVLETLIETSPPDSSQ